MFKKTAANFVDYRYFHPGSISGTPEGWQYEVSRWRNLLLQTIEIFPSEDFKEEDPLGHSLNSSLKVIESGRIRWPPY